MSISDPNQNVSSQPEPQRTVSKPIYTYAVSWKWLIIGLVFVLVMAGAACAMFFVQSSNQSVKILDVVQSMVEESDKAKAKFEQTSDPKEKQELFTRSLKVRGEAANLLNDYRQQNTLQAGSAVLVTLYDILEGLYLDYGENTTPNGKERGRQLHDLAVELANTVSDAESIKYRLRLLELAWDRRGSDRQAFSDIISRGLGLLEASRALGGASNSDYDAMRYIAMALFDNLQIEPYQPSLYKLPSTSFPETMDELLGKLNTMKPEDIEIAKRYAEFIVNVDKPERPNFSACASDDLHSKGQEERNTLAKNRIDDMVQRNQDNAAAYLARYHFVSQLLSSDEVLDQANPDLEMVLKLSPSNPEGLISSGVHARNQMLIALKNGETDRALEWQNQAEDYFRRTVKDNPTYPMGYLYYGDFMLFQKKQPKEAVEIWDQGLSNTNFRNDEELIGRVVMILLDQRSADVVERVREKLEHLTRTIADMQYSSPKDVRRTTEMQELLTARLYYTESKIAAAKIESAMRENRLEEARRLYNVVQQKQGDAMQKFDHILRDFGKSREDYEVIFEKGSVYNLLLPQSLVQAGELKLEWSQWDAAASYFERASRFEATRQQALLASAIAYQNGRRLNEAVQVLRSASERDPDNLQVRYTYAMTLFRSQVSSNNPDPAVLEIVQKELEALESRRNELQQPWALDMRLIHLGVARADLTNTADIILEAMNEAVRKYRALERGTFPPDAEGNVKNYIDDPAFVTEMVGIYSSLAYRSDYDRLLLKLRELPDGEGAYFDARVNDCIRRDDGEGAITVIGEALESERLPDDRKDRFIALLQRIRGEDVDNSPTLDNLYTQLQTTFDRSPETLKPQAFFLLAKMSLERSEVEQAKRILERLRKLEGPEGRNWQYIDIRLMLNEKDPDYVTMRQKLESLTKIAPFWDETYILASMVESQYLATSPGDTDARDRLIMDYRMAIQNGSMIPEIWQRLTQLLAEAGRTEEAKEITRNAALKGVVLQTPAGQFPQPFSRMYTQVQEAIANNDAIGADEIARQCIVLAERRIDNPNLLFSLHLALGKLFFDASMNDSALRHLSQTAKRGGTDVYPLALCLAKSGNVDAGYALLLDEIPTTPALLPSVLVLLAQVKPTEAIYERIDQMMELIEKGERLTLKGVAVDSEVGNTVSLGTQRVPSRKIQTFAIRFLDKTERIDPSLIQFTAPVEPQTEVPAQPPVPETPTVQPVPAQPVSAQPVPAVPVAQPVPAQTAPAAPTPLSPLLTPAQTTPVEQTAPVQMAPAVPQ